jgi:hypothetical protein
MKHSVAQTVDQRAPKGIPSKEDYAVQQADDMRSRRAYHESPVIFASVGLFSSCVSRPFHGQMRFNADLSMTRMGTGGYLRQMMVQKPARHHHHRTFEQSQGKVL